MRKTSSSHNRDAQVGGGSQREAELTTETATARPHQRTQHDAVSISKREDATAATTQRRYEKLSDATAVDSFPREHQESDGDRPDHGGTGSVVGNGDIGSDGEPDVVGREPDTFPRNNYNESEHGNTLEGHLRTGDDGVQGIDMGDSPRSSMLPLTRTENQESDSESEQQEGGGEPGNRDELRSPPPLSRRSGRQVVATVTDSNERRRSETSASKEVNV